MKILLFGADSSYILKTNWFSDFDLIKKLTPAYRRQVCLSYKREKLLVKSENQLSFGIYESPLKSNILANPRLQSWGNELKTNYPKRTLVRLGLFIVDSYIDEFYIRFNKTT